MLKEYEVIYAAEDLRNVPKGTVGTVLIVYEASSDYVVEFIDLKTGQTIDVLTVNEAKLRRLENGGSKE